ncbi:MAG: DUF4386 domain-containing protein [Cystobacterineae bacterium]|nr:DUF4386 domain-containing protein [Cystobacterineae bacterium]
MYKKQSIAIGILFLLAMGSYSLGSHLITSSLDDDISNEVSKQLIFGVFLEFINSATVVGIAILLFPILKKHNELASLAYVASRVFESVLLLIASACALLPLFSPEVSYLTGKAFMSFRVILFQLAMVVLGAGSILFCWVLFKSRAIPPMLSLLGMVGYMALFMSGWLAFLGLSTLSILFFIPGGLFELAFPVWLFAKGFSEKEPRTDEQ